MILTSGELLEFMERTPPEEWPTPRGYGYSGPAGKRLKVWHMAVVTEFLNRMAGGDHGPHIESAQQRKEG
jgi:hypothetical protein